MNSVVKNVMDTPKVQEPFKKEEHKRKNSSEEKITRATQEIMHLPPEVRMNIEVIERVIDAVDPQEGTHSAIKATKLLKKIINESSKEVLNEVKTFMQKDEILGALFISNSTINPFIVENKASTSIVKITYQEANFTGIAKILENIFREDDQLRQEILENSAVFEKFLLDLQTPHDSNNITKENAIKRLASYTTLLEMAETSKNSLKEQNKVIEELRAAIENVTTNFKNENEKRRKHLETLFKELVNRHGFLNDTILNVQDTAGENSVAARTFGPAKVVDVPIMNKEKSIVPTVSEERFSEFYTSIHRFYDKIREFVLEIEDHACQVTGKRSTLTKLDPDFEKKKAEASRYKEEYIKLMEQTSLIYRDLEAYTSNLENLKEKLILKLNKHVDDINTKLSNLKKNMFNLHETCRKLDLQINNKVIKDTKDFKVFTI